MPCCEWPSLDVPGDPAFPLAPPISMTVLCSPCPCAVGSTFPEPTQFQFLVSVSLVFPTSVLGKPSQSGTVGAKLSLNPHTPHFSLFSKQILAEKLGLLGSVFIQGAEGRTQPSPRKDSSLWKRTCGSKISNSVSTASK